MGVLGGLCRALCCALSLNFGRKQGSAEPLADAAAGSQQASKRNFTALAIGLAKMPPVQGLEYLRSSDPFEVKDIRTMADFRKAFHCNWRRNVTRGNMLDVEGSFLFYQHIQKAGGTSFCRMASAQMKKSESGAGCRGPAIADRPILNKWIARAKNIQNACKSDKKCLKEADGFAQLTLLKQLPSMQMKNKPRPWIKEQRTPAKFLKAAREQGLRVYSNEFDPFPTDLLDQRNVARVTMLRHPDELLISHYKFFFLSHEFRRAKERGNLWTKVTDIPFNTTLEGWMKAPWNNNFQGNVHGIKHHQEGKGGYVRVFNGGESCQKARHSDARAALLVAAIRALERHCLVMVLELMPLLPHAVEAFLGWKVKFPRAMSSNRELGELYKELDAAKLTPHVHMVDPGVLQCHFFDTIIYYWAKRRMLEKLSGCGDPKEDQAYCPQDYDQPSG